MLKSNFSSVMNWTSGGDAGGHEGGLRSPRWSTQRGSPSWERPSYLAPPSSHPVSERHQSPWVTWVQAEVTPWPPHNVPAPGTAPAGDSSASTGHNGALWPRGQHGAARDELEHRGGANPLLGGQLCTPHRPHSPIPGDADPYPGGPAPPMGLKPCGVPAPHPHPALSAHSPQKGGPSPPPSHTGSAPAPNPGRFPAPSPMNCVPALRPHPEGSQPHTRTIPNPIGPRSPITMDAGPTPPSRRNTNPTPGGLSPTARLPVPPAALTARLPLGAAGRSGRAGAGRSARSNSPSGPTMAPHAPARRADWPRPRPVSVPHWPPAGRGACLRKRRGAASGASGNSGAQHGRRPA